MDQTITFFFTAIFLLLAVSSFIITVMQIDERGGAALQAAMLARAG